MADFEMGTEQREAFLADLHVGVLAIERDGKGPLAVPIWYAYADGDVLISMAADSAKTTLLRRAGRATMTVQDERPPYRYVSVEGPVSIEAYDDVDAYDIEAVAKRYLGDEAGAQYAAANPSWEGTVIARITPERWLTVDYGAG
ncbi:PPOX class probable F420-dependent enzyme [Ilumatobacter fluminis]|uniref:PPOX class probable F420-dependent enzyme n=1 Tax=Ilumatobacter fluminis TaxID=467091 RepID=A0A4R7I5W1_9ACTN|nr:PPOX class F420-dependent oxidoreductase [Ilumatobacter fluminis]TDT18083.1 PPOX class probable F420-dependent enzyme [Ilumatobacter fluminis]